jgi:hypothetical protein
MILYAICINPLLHALDTRLTGLRIGRRQARTSVIAYADVVTILLTNPPDIPRLQEVLQSYEGATGAKANIRKSRAVALGFWDTTHRILDIPYHNEAKILEFHIANTVKESAHKSWTMTTGQIRAHAQEAYYRGLSLDRIQYAHDHLMARVWYLAQISPPPPETCVRQLNTTVAWFLWRGIIFLVPLSTLQRKKGQGGWGLQLLSAKNHALFYSRLQHYGSQTGTVTAEWLHRLGSMKGNENPPHRNRIPATFFDRLSIHSGQRTN